MSLPLCPTSAVTDGIESPGDEKGIRSPLGPRVPCVEARHLPFVHRVARDWSHSASYGMRHAPQHTCLESGRVPGLSGRWGWTGGLSDPLLWTEFPSFGTPFGTPFLIQRCTAQWHACIRHFLFFASCIKGLQIAIQVARA